MANESMRTPSVAVRAVCVRCGMPFSYYICLARGQNKTTDDFEIPKIPVCRNCNSRIVETSILKTHVRGGYN